MAKTKTELEKKNNKELFIAQKHYEELQGEIAPVASSSPVKLANSSWLIAHSPSATSYQLGAKISSSPKAGSPVMSDYRHTISRRQFLKSLVYIGIAVSISFFYKIFDILAAFGIFTYQDYNKIEEAFNNPHIYNFIANSSYKLFGRPVDLKLDRDIACKINKILNGLERIEENKKEIRLYARRSNLEPEFLAAVLFTEFIGMKKGEAFSDLFGSIFKDTSIGLGQMRVSTFRMFYPYFFGMPTEFVPDFVIGVILQDDRLNIEVAARYLRDLAWTGCRNHNFKMLKKNSKKWDDKLKIMVAASYTATPFTDKILSYPRPPFLDYFDNGNNRNINPLIYGYTVLEAEKIIKGLKILNSTSAQDKLLGSSSPIALTVEQRQMGAEGNLASQVRKCCLTYQRFFWQVARKNLKGSMPRAFLRKGRICEYFPFILAKVLCEVFNLPLGDSTKTSFVIKGGRVEDGYNFIGHIWIVFYYQGRQVLLIDPTCFQFDKFGKSFKDKILVAAYNKSAGLGYIDREKIAIKFGIKDRNNWLVKDIAIVDSLNKGEMPSVFSRKQIDAVNRSIAQLASLLKPQLGVNKTKNDLMAIAGIGSVNITRAVPAVVGSSPVANHQEAGQDLKSSHEVPQMQPAYLSPHRFQRRFRLELIKLLEELTAKGKLSRRELNFFKENGLMLVDAAGDIRYFPKIYFKKAVYVLNKVLGRTARDKNYITVGKLRSALLQYAKVLRNLKQHMPGIARINEALKSIGERDYSRLMRYFVNQYGEIKNREGRVDELLITESLIAHLYLEKFLGNRDIKLLDDGFEGIYLNQINPRIKDILESHISIWLEERFSQLLKEFSATDPALWKLKLLIKAYDIAKRAHGQNIRMNKITPYLDHPIQGARIILTEFKEIDIVLIAAGLLHDVAEKKESHITVGDIRQELNSVGDEFDLRNKGEIDITVDEITNCVRAVTKPPIALFKIEKYPKQAQLEAYFRWLSKEGVKARIVKIADRIHNIRTLKNASEKFQIRYFRSTVYKFLPMFMQFKDIDAQIKDKLLRQLIVTGRRLDFLSGERNIFLSDRILDCLQRYSNLPIQLTPVNPQKKYPIKLAILDWGGTISLISEGWQDIMAALTASIITGVKLTEGEWNRITNAIIKYGRIREHTYLPAVEQLVESGRLSPESLGWAYDMVEQTRGLTAITQFTTACAEA
ncbi:MAG: hypothetical protein PHY46_04795, partial [Candidatus Omnitrophica bacterium]|nr:hypothetical protein [Candidatus Omnitrophota bacterium]